MHKGTFMDKCSQSDTVFFSQRFFPYFVTQFFGAFNDNIYKNTLLIFVAFASANQLPISSTLFINLAAGIFILPFFLFSATAGVIADKYEKSKLIRWIKFAEIIIMIAGAISFLYQSYLALLILLFLMGTQSAFFGPVKYALLPQHLKPAQLLKGNAWVETGTFLAILFGTIGAGIIVATPNAYWLTAVSVVFFAVLGFIASLFIPKALPSPNHYQFSWKPIFHTQQTLNIAKQNRTIHLSIIAISWFWFLGACYLTQFPNFSKTYIQGDSTSVSFLLALFSVGIAIGSLLCAKLSHQKINLKLVGLGGVGISIFSVLLGLFSILIQTTSTNDMISITNLLSSANYLPIFFSLFFLGMCGGTFIVPLYTLMQTLASTETRAQVIAANNIYNALFMVGSAIISIVCLSLLSMAIHQFFIFLGILNLLVIFGLYRYKPQTMTPESH